MTLNFSSFNVPGKELVPSQQAAYLACASKNKSNPDRCDASFNDMWTGVNNRVTAINADLTKDVLSEEDQEIILDCNGFRNTEGSIEPWLQCTVPRRCPKELERYSLCIARGDSSKCVEDGRPLVRCLGDFVARFAVAGQKN